MASATINVRLETNVQDVIADLQLLQRAASASVEVAQRLLELGELTADDLVVDRERPAALPASCAWIGFQLPKGFRELVSAVRAGEFGVSVAE